MPQNLPYLVSYKNVGVLFDRILTAKVPETSFTHDFLSNTIGLKSTADRGLISLLKALKFLEPSGKPTPAYSLLKNSDTRGGAIAKALTIAYEPLYAANQEAHTLAQKELKGLVAQVAGSDEDMTTKIAGTYSALARIADFSKKSQPQSVERKKDLSGPKDDTSGEEIPKRDHGLRHEFHYNIQIHLPSNASEETYLNIFSAFRKIFK